MVRRVLLDSAYSLSAFVVALPAFVLLVMGLALSAGTVVLLAGFFVLVLTAYVARGFARLERHRLRTLQGVEDTAPAYRCPDPEPSSWRPVVTVLGDAQSWRDLLWSLVGLVTGTLAFAVTLLWWTVAAGGLSYWFWQRFIPADDDGDGLAALLGLGSGRTPESLVDLGLGAVAMLTLPLVVRGVAALHGGLARLLLLPGRDAVAAQPSAG